MKTAIRNPQSKTNKTRARALVVSLVLLPLWGAVGCSSIQFDVTRWLGTTPDPATLPAIIEPRVFLGGEALAQKKARMRRVHADLVHLLRGYEIVERQHKRSDQEQLEGLIRPYLASQAAPLIAGDDEAWNPDLRMLEANLLFAEGALLVAIGEDTALAAVIDTLETRFEGYGSLLVEYPIGQTQTLASGIKDLRGAQASL